MIGPEDIDAFREDNSEAISQASEYARRAGKGLPVDRWASARQAHLVARGIKAMQAIIRLQTAAIEALANADTATKR